MNLCYLAAGRFDLAWTYSTKIWDVAAGVLIIREAGGTVVAPGGAVFSLEKPYLWAAANERLYAEFREIAGNVAD